MQLSDIDSWNVGALKSIAFELGDELKTIDGVASDLELISRLPGWDSPAADAARGKIRDTTARVLDDAAAIGAVAQLAEETEAAVAKMQTELAGIRGDVTAQGGLLTLSDSGDVTINAPPDMRDELRPIADSVEARAKALIHQAEDVDADCAEVFGHLEHGDITARGATDFASAQEVGRDQSGLSAPSPPDGTPQDSNAWWNALSEDEQRKVVAEHPEWLGNRDGVPVPVRSQVNEAALDRELAAAQREVDATPSLRDYLREHGGTGPGSYLQEGKYDQMVRDRQARLDNARSMKEALSIGGDPSKGYDPNKYLMQLEFPEGREPRAAIAVGNPDTAEHVSVTAPGVDTRATSLPGMVAEATALRAETGQQLDLAGRGNEEVSTIAWLGYEPPSTSDISIAEAGSESRANEAAPDLADFYRGINATNEHGSDVHLSALGHSYGSLTTAQALNELGATGVVDDAAFYGSPGLGHTDATTTEYGVHGAEATVPVPIRDESDLFLADGHAYVMSAPEDPISGDPKWHGIPYPSAGDLDVFGPNPTTLPFEQLSAESATSPTDHQPREGASSHADYPRMGDGDRLRTTGYNLSIIVADLADLPLPNGEDRLIR